MSCEKLNIVVDLDGTTRCLKHRRHLVADGNHKWDEFFASCDKDEPIWGMIKVAASHINSGHHLEFRSGACESSFDKTVVWLDKYFDGLIDWDSLDYTDRSMGQFVTHMRPEKDYSPDTELKKKWLYASEYWPDIAYDDRFSVVEMYRGEGVFVAQVDWGDFDSKTNFNIPRKPTLTLMIGPSGSGKDYWLQFNAPTPNIVSSDNLRYMQFPSDEKFCDDAAYTSNGFKATFTTAHNVIKAYLEGGVDCIYNATNIRAKNRKEMLKHVGADTGKYNVEYVIVDRSLEEKLNSFNMIESDGHTSEDIIRKHHQTFQSSKKHALKGDGFDFIDVKVVDNFYEDVIDNFAKEKVL